MLFPQENTGSQLLRIYIKNTFSLVLFSDSVEPAGKVFVSVCKWMHQAPLSPALPQAQLAVQREREALSRCGESRDRTGDCGAGLVPFLAKILGADFLKNDFIWTVQWDRRGKDVCKHRRQRNVLAIPGSSRKPFGS